LFEIYIGVYPYILELNLIKQTYFDSLNFDFIKSLIL